MKKSEKSLEGHFAPETCFVEVLAPQPDRHGPDFWGEKPQIFRTSTILQAELSQ